MVITMPPAIADSKSKRVLLIDAVDWSTRYPADHPLRQVPQWYARWFTELPGLSLHSLRADADVLGAVRSGLDGVIMSGSPRDAWRDDPINARLGEVIQECRDRSVPFLGVCYGHQLLGRVLGAKVAPHPQGLELGNTPVELTPAGQRSALYRGLPARFEVLSSHVDVVCEMPPGAELQVRGEFAEIQGFHWRERLYGVQFHPETDPEVLRFIWSARRETWRSKVSFDLDQRLEALMPTPLAAQLLRNFIIYCIP
jgi:GMP synthase (glutamine-hydrolysing)